MLWLIEVTRWNVTRFHLLCRVLTWKIKHQSNSVAVHYPSARGNTIISGAALSIFWWNGMAWLARPPRRRGFECWLWVVSFLPIPRRYWGRGAFAWMQGCALALRARLVVR
jgi:hypothetical protein